MAINPGKRWKHSGRTSSDYSRSSVFDHDKRTYATISNFGKGPRQKRSDEHIHDEACELLYWHPDVDASEVEVKVKDNVVYLEGTVDSRHAKKMAGILVERIRGVFDVFNRLSIKSDLDLDSDKIITRGDEGLFSQETIQR